MPQLNIALGGNISDSPLLTPKDPPNRLMSNVLLGVIKQQSQNENMDS